MLYPIDTETGEVKDLSGIRKFKREGDKSHILMPVPSSYNDITQELALRDHQPFTVRRPLPLRMGRSTASLPSDL